MASVNKVIVLGNIGKDPEVRHMPSGGAVCQVSIATSRKWKDKQSGEMQEETEWHRVTFFDRLAEIAGEYLRKGKPVYVEGRLRTRKYTDKDGVEKYATEIVAESMQLLGGRDDGDAGGNAPAPRGAPQRQQAPQSRAPAPQQRQQAAQGRAPTGFDDMDDDIPF